MQCHNLIDMAEPPVKKVKTNSILSYFSKVGKQSECHSLHPRSSVSDTYHSDGVENQCGSEENLSLIKKPPLLRKDLSLVRKYLATVSYINHFLSLDPMKSVC